MASVSSKIQINTMTIAPKYWATWFCESWLRLYIFPGVCRFNWTIHRLCRRHLAKWWSCDVWWPWYDTVIERQSKRWKLKSDIQSKCPIAPKLTLLHRLLIASFSRFFEIFEKYDGYKHGHVKLKRPKQLQEILDIARYLLSEIQTKSAEPSIEEKQGKLEQLKSVLEM